MKRNRNYWNYQTILLHSKECNDRKEFYKKFRRGYNLALELGVLHEIFPSRRKPKGYWSIDKIIKEGNKYSTIKEFSENNITAYTLAVKLNLIDSFNFKKIGNKYNRCIYCFIFEDNKVYVGLTYDYEKRTKQHITEKSSSVFKHIKNNIKIKFKHFKLTDYIDKEEASIKEGEILQYFIDKGYTPLNKKKTGFLGGSNRKWSIEKLQIVFSKYDNCTQLVKSKDSNAYYSALYNKWLHLLSYKNK